MSEVFTTAELIGDTINRGDINRRAIWVLSMTLPASNMFLIRKRYFVPWVWGGTADTRLTSADCAVWTTRETTAQADLDTSFHGHNNNKNHRSRNWRHNLLLSVSYRSLKNLSMNITTCSWKGSHDFVLTTQTKIQISCRLLRFLPGQSVIMFGSTKLSNRKMSFQTPFVTLNGERSRENLNL